MHKDDKKKKISRKSRNILRNHFSEQTFSAFKVSVFFFFQGIFLAGITHLDALSVFYVIFNIV